MNIFSAENVCRKMMSNGASKEQMAAVYLEAYSFEHKQLPQQHRLHNNSHGVRRSEVVGLIVGEKVTVDQIARALPLYNPVAAREAALFHLNCLMNEGVLQRVYEKKATWYQLVKRAS